MGESVQCSAVSCLPLLIIPRLVQRPMTTSSSLPARAIVTGHTRGLGAAIAEALLARGIAVLGIARTRSSAPPTGEFSEVEIDLGDEKALAQWLARGDLAAFLHGASQAYLINNAGTVQPIGPGSAQTPDAIARAVMLNVAAPMMLASAFAAASAGVPDRRIAHVSSGAARNVYAGWSVYCATKAALDHHARAVALDAEPGLRIASVAPGVVDTDMQAEIRGTDTAQFPSRERFVEMKRGGQLASPQAAAGQFVAHLLDEAFGSNPAVDVRSLA